MIRGSPVAPCGCRRRGTGRRVTKIEMAGTLDCRPIARSLPSPSDSANPCVTSLRLFPMQVPTPGGTMLARPLRSACAGVVGIARAGQR
jgi:hypothetical protein